MHVIAKPRPVPDDVLPAAAPTPRPRAEVFAIGLWFAFLGAFAELTLLGYDRFVRHHAIRVGPQVLWMTPAADALLFLVVALVLLGLGRVWSPLASTRFRTAVFTFLAGLGVMAIEYWQYPIAAAILALGAAVQAGRVASDRSAGFHRLIRRTLPVFAAIVVLLGGGWNVFAWARERRALTALPAARPGSPNVLLLIWDTVRARSLSLYGYVRPTTPELQRFASGGVTFEQAIATAPWTLASHAGMFTGRYPNELSVGWLKPLDTRYQTLSEALDRSGYVTAGFAANTIYASYEYGLNRGFVHYEDYRVTPGEFVLASSLLRSITNRPWLRRLVGTTQILGRKSAGDVNADVLAWLDRRPKDRPFFVFVNEFDAHEPYLPPAPFDTLFGRLPRWSNWHVMQRTNSSEHQRRWTMTQQEVDAERNAYEASIAYMDAELGELLRSLKARGLLDNTIVVIAGDHGEEFGRHKVFSHGNSLYLPVLHVPLVVAWPGHVPAGRRVADAVSLRDLPATVLDLIDRPQTPFPGRSLARFWAQDTPGRPGEESVVASEVDRMPSAPIWYPVHPSALRSVLADGFHLIRGVNGHEELYDVRTDSLEAHDLAGDPRYAAVIARLRLRMPPDHKHVAVR